MVTYLMGAAIYILVFSLFEIFLSKRWALGVIVTRAIFWPLSLLAIIIMGYLTALLARDALDSK